MTIDSSVYHLNNGLPTPKVGLGTSRCDNIKEAVLHALKTGYRHLDCAWFYDNEKEIGEAIKESGIPRNELFITSKLWTTFQHPDLVAKGLQETLDNLQLDYLDLFLMHWPVCHVNAGDGSYVIGEDKLPVIDNSVSLKDTWTALEALVDQGKTKSIGVSNFNVPRLAELLAFSRIKPAVNQVELHPYLPQHELVDFCKQEKVLLTGYGPLGGYPGPESVLHDSVVAQVAQKNGISPAQVLLSWAVQRGTQPIPKSTNLKRIEENLKHVDLSDDDMKLIDAIHKKKTVRYFDVVKNWGIDVFSYGYSLSKS